jgi:hypothetical protein
MGTVDFYAGTAVPFGGTLTSSYRLSFLGSVNYDQEMTPSPEPATLSLLALGAVAILRRRK